jgi:alanine or glycine:cation symporter, AGCS family
LAVKYQVVGERNEMADGPMYYIERGLGWKWLAVLFALFGSIAAFGIGSMVQSNSVAESMQASFSVNPWITGVVLTVITGLVILGGIKSIGRVTSFLVPFYFD